MSYQPSLLANISHMMKQTSLRCLYGYKQSLGENEKFLVNTNCSIICLLQHFRSKLGLTETGRFDGTYVSITPHVANPDSALQGVLQNQAVRLEQTRRKNLHALRGRKVSVQTKKQSVRFYNPASK
ncbi:hypothetical protein HF521_018561 [Silurus meridionalis]|uniref:Uncharacterized protein n=1 Tax=Silurus meridionalis TaxID=175797 RepID=A0A8T0BM88_SILME|nr:hypothetical protein HF521_018561 [Silurus meridionalis]